MTMIFADLKNHALYVDAAVSSNTVAVLLKGAWFRSYSSEVELGPGFCRAPLL